MGMSLQDALAVQKTSERLKVLARRGKKVYLGKETRPGWTGYLPFYLFQCPNCRKLVKDYPHGFTTKEYLMCPECRERIDFVPRAVLLKEFFQTFLFMFRLVFSKKLR